METIEIEFMVVRNQIRLDNSSYLMFKLGNPYSFINFLIFVGRAILSKKVENDICLTLGIK